MRAEPVGCSGRWGVLPSDPATGRSLRAGCASAGLAMANRANRQESQ